MMTTAPLCWNQRFKAATTGDFRNHRPWLPWCWVACNSLRSQSQNFWSLYAIDVTICLHFSRLWLVQLVTNCLILPRQGPSLSSGQLPMGQRSRGHFRGQDSLQSEQLILALVKLPGQLQEDPKLWLVQPLANQVQDLHLVDVQNLLDLGPPIQVPGEISLSLVWEITGKDALCTSKFGLKHWKYNLDWKWVFFCTIFVPNRKLSQSMMRIEVMI